tara:strand:+ start:1076 stop:1405 length:330 start_codon:yes stop_codon:yes gene_type:complete
LEGIGPMTRFLSFTHYVLLAGLFGGCCYQGSPYCHLNYPNLIGYTYPNWCPPPLKTPPNGPPDEVWDDVQNAERVAADTNLPAEEIPTGTPTPLPDNPQEASVLSIPRR